MNISVTVDIEKSKPDVWHTVSNIEQAASFISGIQKVTVLNKPNQGLIGFKWQETRIMFGKEATEVMWITDAVDEEFYQTRAESHGMIYQSRIKVTSIEKGTQLTMTFAGEATSFIGKAMSKIMCFFYWLNQKAITTGFNRY